MLIMASQVVSECRFVVNCPKSAHRPFCTGRSWPSVDSGTGSSVNFSKSGPWLVAAKRKQLHHAEKKPGRVRVSNQAEELRDFGVWTHGGVCAPMRIVSSVPITLALGVAQLAHRLTRARLVLVALLLLSGKNLLASNACPRLSIR